MKYLNHKAIFKAILDLPLNSLTLLGCFSCTLYSIGLEVDYRSCICVTVNIYRVINGDSYPVFFFLYIFQYFFWLHTCLTMNYFFPQQVTPSRTIRHQNTYSTLKKWRNGTNIRTNHSGASSISCRNVIIHFVRFPHTRDTYVNAFYAVWICTFVLEQNAWNSPLTLSIWFRSCRRQRTYNHSLPLKVWCSLVTPTWSERSVSSQTASIWFPDPMTRQWRVRNFYERSDLFL